MKILINDQFIEKIIEYYNALGFKISKEDIENTELNYNEVKVSYTADNGKTIEKLLKDININDLNSAYYYVNSHADSEREKLIKKVAFTTIFDYIKKESSKSRVNKKLINYLTNKNNLNEELNNNIDNPEIKKVVEVEEDKKTADNGYIIIAGVSFAALAIVLICNIASYKISEKDSKSENQKNKTEQSCDAVDNNTETNDTIVEENENKEEMVKVEETENKEEMVEVEEKIDVNSEEYINKVTDNIYEKISSTGLENEYSKDYIKELVIYAHHTYEGFDGENIISNETAYEDYSNLIRHGVNVSMFFDGLNGYEDLNSLNNALTNVKQELGEYDDEYKAYKEIENTLNNINEDNYSEAVALRAYVDQYTIVPSMQVARDGAEENGEEGPTYYEEKDGISASKKQECREIFNSIDVNNQNAKLTIIINKALEKENKLSR